MPTKLISSIEQVMQLPAVITSELWDPASIELANTINKYVTDFWLSGKASVLTTRHAKDLQKVCECLSARGYQVNEIKRKRDYSDYFLPESVLSGTHRMLVITWTPSLL